MRDLFITIETHSGDCIEGRCYMVLSDYALGIRTGNRVRIVLRREIKRIIGRSAEKVAA